MIAIVFTTVVSGAILPAILVRSTSVSLDVFSRNRFRPVYANLPSRIDTTAGNTYSVLTVNFVTPAPDNASIFFSVGTFVRPGQCCPGAYLELISVDNGPLGAGQGLGCGGQTSQFTGVLVGVSCFGRLAFAPGSHSVTLNVQNGGGAWTIEQGPSTAIMLQFD